jgi:fibronectin type 3 domain-containing protein
LAPGTTYQYRVIATSPGGNSAPSATATATTMPAAPTGLSAMAVSSTAIAVTWQVSSGATGYRVERAANGGTSWTTAGTTSATTFTDGGLAPVTTYQYRVIATNSAGSSAPSATVTATTLPDTTPPTPPQNLVATAARKSISLSWNPSTDSGGSGLAGYSVWRSTSGAPGTFNFVAATTETSYTDTGLKKTTYRYVVVAYDWAGNYAVSPVVNARAR